MKKIILGLTCVLMLASCSIKTNEKVEIESIPTKQEDEDLSAQGVEVEPLSEDIPPERIEIKRTAEVREVRLEASSKTEKKKPKVSKVRKAKEPVKVKKAKVKTNPSTKTKTKAKATKPVEKTKPVERAKPKTKTKVKTTKPVEKAKPKTKPVEKTKPETKPETKPVENTKPKTKPVEKTKPTEEVIRFELTFFTTLPEHNGGWTVTATGKNLVGLNNAVASNYYPLGTKIKLEGFGTVTVMDRGGPNFNSPKRLDVLVQRKKGESNSAYTKRIWKMGRQKVNGCLTK